MLIPKRKNSAAGGIIRARPICLLDNIGKLIERIIADRLLQHMEDMPATDLSDRQFSFRRGRSTVDALNFVVDTIRRKSDYSEFQ